MPSHPSCGLAHAPPLPRQRHRGPSGARARAHAWILAAIALLLAACSTVQAPAAWQPPAALDPVSSTQWAADMARFAREDQARPPPPAPAVFAGSSSFRMWQTLAADFSGVPVLNRGFGGAQVRDLAWHADAVAIRYAPSSVLLYAGDNDIDAGRSPQRVLQDFQLVVARLRHALPDAAIAFVAIKPSPARVSQLAAQREANVLIERWARTQRGVAFIDVATPMLDGNGLPREDLFLADRLHMNARGYALWRDAIAPWLR